MIGDRKWLQAHHFFCSVSWFVLCWLGGPFSVTITWGLTQVICNEDLGRTSFVFIQNRWPTGSNKKIIFCSLSLPLSVSDCLSVCPSQTHTHIHTHTHTQTHTHTHTRAHTLCWGFFCFCLFFENRSNNITAGTFDWLLTFFPVYADPIR